MTSSVNEHAHRFQPDAWKDYTIAELAMWVHLLRKRAGHRLEPEKAEKDLADAANYESMMFAAIDAAKP